MKNELVRSSKTTQTAHVNRDGFETMCGRVIKDRWVDGEGAPTICEECRDAKRRDEEMILFNAEDKLSQKNDEKLREEIEGGERESDFRTVYQSKRGSYFYEVASRDGDRVLLNQIQCTERYSRWTTIDGLKKAYTPIDVA
jgi:hypothetical protein